MPKKTKDLGDSERLTANEIFDAGEQLRIIGDQVGDDRVFRRKLH